MEEEITNKISDFLKENYEKEINLLALSENNSIIIDFKLLEAFDILLAESILEEPEKTIKMFEEVIRNMDIPIEESRKEKIRVRFINLPEKAYIRIKNLREKHLKKFICVDGIIKRASEIRPEIYKVLFKCRNEQCGYEWWEEQNERFLKKPLACSVCKRRNLEMTDKKLRDARWIVIEEPFELRGGESTSELFIYLTEDLVSEKNRIKTEPGNRIKVFGILKEIPKRVKGRIYKEMEIYLEANNFETIETQWEDIEISDEDEKKIKELASDKNIYNYLVESVAPSIFGYDEVKLAIILQMFGGVEIITEDKVRIRGDLNILLVGEPATAKSQFLKTVAQIMPRAKYVSGKAATKAGLIATVTRDEEFLGGWVLEAGAVVLSNNSVCCIDEFEKIEKDDMIALHEVMEQQSVSIAKASIVATLPARTAILAAANPKFGRFDEIKPISEQLTIPETILTRFDLKFALRDVPDIEKDKKMIEHIEKVRYFQTEEMSKPKIDVDLLRKYIAYARARCKPKLTIEAAEKLKEFYLSLRKASAGGVISITTRQYESLVRLAQASAKIQLRDFVDKEDVERAINIILFSLKQFGQDITTGTIDIDKAEGQKITHEHRSKIKLVESIINDLEIKHGKTIPLDELIKIAKENGIFDIENILKKMKEVGEILEPRPGKIERIKRILGI
ncbi:MAG: minichromosome maintenance protein MCM [Candidatus Aenigmarchaeota archaeon]|nr:minichromosome maintenance protein MCM [Candidatus Aenigmarchaeota archaeon]MDW8149771.1 minichromosome maintenance protein MCM [Candidatus Aenigmarchaeota archaeon]